MTIEEARRILEKGLPPHENGCPSYPVDIAACACPIPIEWTEAKSYLAGWKARGEKDLEILNEDLDCPDKYHDERWCQTCTDYMDAAECFEQKIQKLDEEGNK